MRSESEQKQVEAYLAGLERLARQHNRVVSRMYKDQGHGTGPAWPNVGPRVKRS